MQVSNTGLKGDPSPPRARTAVQPNDGSLHLRGIWKNPAAWWRASGLDRQFLIAATIIIVFTLTGLGVWIERRMREAWLQGVAETGAFYLTGILSPHIAEREPSLGISRESRARLQELLQLPEFRNHVARINIWGLDGKLIYSTHDWPGHTSLAANHLAKLMSGRVVIDTDIDDDVPGQAKPPSSDMFEVYAPLRNSQKDIVAIGEFYHHRQALDAEIAQVRLLVAMMMLTAAVVLIVMIKFIVDYFGDIIRKQQLLLLANIKRAEILAKRHQGLRRAANRARLNAIATNESYLAHIGADIHDGPIQILSLIMLRLPNEAGCSPAHVGSRGSSCRMSKDLAPLLKATLDDLRDLSAGLTLPELNELSAHEAIMLAITRHEHHTGTSVAREIGPLSDDIPLAIRVCAYRIVQEALSNAYKHAGGNGQHVKADIDADGERLVIVVSDNGPPSTEFVSMKHRETKLGLKGMQTRARAANGIVSLKRGEHAGMSVMASLPTHAYGDPPEDAPPING